MEIYDSLLQPRALQHDKEFHDQRKANAIRDPSCPRCCNMRNEGWTPITKENFEAFWEFYVDLTPAYAYTFHTVQAVTNIIETYNRIEENVEGGEDSMTTDEMMRRIIRQAERVIGSVRYSHKPTERSQELIGRIASYAKLIAQVRTNEEAQAEQLSAEARSLARRTERAIINKKFDEFWEWYKTITPAVVPSTQAVTTFVELLRLEDEITNSANTEVRRNLHQLIDQITYQDYGFDRNDVIAQIIDRFVYSEAFRLNNDQTEANREQILALSSNEGSPTENTPEGNTPTKNSPQLLTPESESIKSDSSDELIKETEIINAESEDEDIDLQDDNEELLINTPEIQPSPKTSDSEFEIESESSEDSETSEESNNSTSTLQLLFDKVDVELFDSSDVSE